MFLVQLFFFFFCRESIECVMQQRGEYPKYHAADSGNVADQGRGSEISLFVIFPQLYLVAATTDLSIRTITLNYSDHSSRRGLG
jgi:hypothetical protein